MDYLLWGYAVLNRARDQYAFTWPFTSVLLRVGLMYLQIMIYKVEICQSIYEQLR